MASPRQARRVFHFCKESILVSIENKWSFKISSENKLFSGGILWLIFNTNTQIFEPDPQVLSRRMQKVGKNWQKFAKVRTF